MLPTNEKKRPRDSEEKAIISKIYKNRFKNAHYCDYGSNIFYFITSNFTSVVHLTDINEGTTQIDRVGKRIKFKSVQIHGCIYWGPLAPANPLRCVLMFVWDRFPSTTLPSVSDILFPASADGFNNDQNSDRFRILFRKAYDISFTIQVPQSVDEYIDLKGCNSEYGSATNGLYGNVRGGALLMVTMGYEAAVFPYDTSARMFASIRTRFVNEL